MERLPFHRPADRARAHIIEALKFLPMRPDELTDTEVQDFVQLYGDTKHDLSPKVGLMVAEAAKRGIKYVVDPDDPDGEGLELGAVL